MDLDGNGLIDSYGLAKLVFQANNPNARLRGRLSNYRPDTGASTFSFAFERPLVNASQGVSYGASNTYDAQGLGHLVPNWSEVISLSPGLNGFTVNLYNQSGALIQTQHIALKELEERDIQAGHEILDPSTGQVVESVYQVEVIPDSITAKYLFSVARYSSNAGGGSSASAYNYAFALPGRPGAAGDVFGFITNETLSCGTVTNWVEIMNVTNTSMSHTVEFRDSDGVLRGTATETLAPHAQYHYNASAILPLGMTGTVRVSSPVIGAVVGESLIYIHECDRNSLQTAYMTRLYAPGRAAQSASANSYLQMDDELRVAVTVNTPVAVQWGISTFNGESSNGTLNIASFGSTRLALSGNPLVNFPADRYGLITLNSPTLGQYIAEVTRIRRVNVAGQVRYDFVMPTLGR